MCMTQGRSSECGCCRILIGVLCWLEIPPETTQAQRLAVQVTRTFQTKRLAALLTRGPKVYFDRCLANALRNRRRAVPTRRPVKAALRVIHSHGRLLAFLQRTCSTFTYSCAWEPKRNVSGRRRQSEAPRTPSRRCRFARLWHDRLCAGNCYLRGHVHEAPPVFANEGCPRRQKEGTGQDGRLVWRLAWVVC